MVLYLEMRGAFKGSFINHEQLLVAHALSILFAHIVEIWQNGFSNLRSRSELELRMQLGISAEFSVSSFNNADFNSILYFKRNTVKITKATMTS